MLAGIRHPVEGRNMREIRKRAHRSVAGPHIAQGFAHRIKRPEVKPKTGIKIPEAAKLFHRKSSIFENMGGTPPKSVHGNCTGFSRMFLNRSVLARTAVNGASMKKPRFPLVLLERAKGFEPSTPTLARARKDENFAGFT